MFALALTALFVGLNGFFVAAEFALVKLRATQLDQMARSDDAEAKLVVQIFQRLDRYLSATQMGITLASLGLGWVGEPAVAHGLESLAIRAGMHPSPTLHSVAFAVGFSALTAAHIIFGELVPKLIAIGAAERVALTVSRPLQVFYWVMWPGLMVINAGASLLLRALGRPGLHDMEGALSEEEILGMLTQAYAKGRLSQPKRQLLERVMRFTERTVRQAMVPRVDVHWLDADAPFDEAMARAKEWGYTRYPVVEGGDLDKVLGYVTLKDVLLRDEAPTTLRGAVREALCLPEGLGLFEAMREMQRKQNPFAVLVDEYGGTSGIVTLEDILEEIVGEIRDEHDEEAARVEVKGDGTVVADGLVAFDELRSHGVELSGLNADTVGGAVLAALGRVARAGDTARVGDWELRVDSVRRRRVARVSMRRRQRSLPSGPAGDTESRS